MTSSLEYHVSVRHSIPASLALFSLLALPLILVSTSHAQINGAPASVTSPGFGGRAINGTPPSVTSLGPNGLNFRPTFFPPPPNPPHARDGHHRHHDGEYITPAVVYPVPVPYAVDYGAANSNNDNDNTNDDDKDATADDTDANYNGGPAGLDHRLDRRESGRFYITPPEDFPRPHAAPTADAPAADPEPPQEPTILVFKDGRQIELRNYAIIGTTLFDLTLGHPRRVALADLDLDATRKQNDDRGVSFQLPPPSQAN
jgi:hypothetical protein